jgi:hypothetical protein
VLKNLCGDDQALRGAVLDLLAGQYWSPVYGFPLQSGHDEADSKDLLYDPIANKPLRSKRLFARAVALFDVEHSMDTSAAFSVAMTSHHVL